MNRIGLLFLGFASLTTMAGEPSAALSLDECIGIALSDNPTVRIADMEVTKADYSRRETIGALLPTLSFDGTYSRTLKKQVAYMDFDAFGDMMPGGSDAEGGEVSPDAGGARSGGASDGIKMGLDNMWSTGFSASVPLIAPQLWQSLRLSDTQIARAAEQARSSRLDLVNQVKAAYYALLLAHDTRRTVQESYDMAALTHDIYTKRHSAGDASEYDVLRTSVAMKNVEPEIIQADIAVRRAHLQLAILMGLDADAPFDIDGTLADYTDDIYADALTLSSDLSQNTALRTNAIETDALRRQLSAQRASLLPTLALSANYMWNSSSNGSPFRNFRWTPYSMLGLTLSVPIFQGGQRMNRIKQARIALDEMTYTRDNLTRQLSSQVTLAHENIRLNVKQITSSTESVDEATRAHDIQQRSFDIGAASYLDLRDSELSLTRARLGYYQAVYNYLVARAELELLLGDAPIEKYSK
jgi:outer membrane efflux protein